MTPQSFRFDNRRKVIRIVGAGYLASESSFARVMRAQGQTAHRGRAKAPHAVRPPTTHIASAVRQVWCWDMTYLPAIVIGRWFYLYLILDLYSRKIVGWEVHTRVRHQIPISPVFDPSPLTKSST
jgi:transposase InsO family protein